MSKYYSPNLLARIAHVGLRAQRPMDGTMAGRHRSPLHGASPEFADHREYAPGDDLKHLDWRVYARSNRHYIKRFEEESNLRATVLLDCSASMAYPKPGKAAGRRGDRPTKFDIAARITAALSALFVRQRDAVGLITLDHAARMRLRPSSTQTQLSKILSVLDETRPDRTTSLGPVIHEAADRIAHRGMIVLVSDLLTDLDALYAALGRLQHDGHELLLFHVLDRDELELPFDDPVVFQDIEGSERVHAEPWAFRTAYRQAMDGFVNGIRRQCQVSGADYLLVRTDEDLGLTLSRWLHERGRRPPVKHRGRFGATGRASENVVRASSPRPEGPA